MLINCIAEFYLIVVLRWGCVKIAIDTNTCGQHLVSLFARLYAFWGEQFLSQNFRVLWFGASVVFVTPQLQKLSVLAIHCLNSFSSWFGIFSTASTLVAIHYVLRFAALTCIIMSIFDCPHDLVFAALSTAMEEDECKSGTWVGLGWGKGMMTEVDTAPGPCSNGHNCKFCNCEVTRNRLAIPSINTQKFVVLLLVPELPVILCLASPEVEE